jgi:hypothetical protein
VRQYEAQIIGFALSSCKVCRGTGRQGFIGPMEKGIVEPCICVVFFEKSTLLKEAELGKQEQQRTSGVAETRKREGDSLSEGS